MRSLPGNNAAFLALLDKGDARELRIAWAQVMPNMPQPATDKDAEIQMHIARTIVPDPFIAFSKRAYSHRWLTERGLPSQLPDKLRPRAERMYPKIVTAVGIACGSNSPLMSPIVPFVRRAMEEAVLDCYAEGDTDPVHIKSRIMDARGREVSRLVGIILDAG